MAARTRPSPRSVLSVPGFRRLLSVRLVSQFADGLVQAALAGSVLFNPDRYATPVAIAAGTALLVVPYSLVGAYVGVFLDRWPRRRVLVWTNLVRAALVLLIAASIHAGQFGAGFAAAAFLVIGLNRFLLAGHSAAIPHAVDDRRLVTANSLAGTLGSISFSAGLGVALVVVTRVLPVSDNGYAIVALAAPIGYVTSALLAARWFTDDQLGPDHPPVHASIGAATTAAARGVVEGIRHLGRRRGAAYAIIAQGGFRVVFGGLALMLLLLYRNYFNVDDVRASINDLGYVVLAGGLGVLAAAVLTPPITRRIGGWRWIAGLLSGLGAVLLGLGWPLDPPLLLAVVFCANVTGQGLKIVTDTSVQHECDDDYRGRVFAVNDTMFNLAYVAGMFATAWAVPEDGYAPLAVVVAAAAFAILAAWYVVAAGRWARREGDDIAAPHHPAVPTPVA